MLGRGLGSLLFWSSPFVRSAPRVSARTLGTRGRGVSAAGPTHRTSYVTSRLMAFEVTAQDTQMDMIRYMMRLAVSFIIEGAFLPRETGPSSRVVWGAPTLNLVRAKLPFCLGPSSAANLEPVEICL